MYLEFNKPYLAGYENATVCCEPLFSCVEKKLEKIPEYVKCTASPFAFCISDKLINEAVALIDKNNCITIGCDDDVLLTLINERISDKTRSQSLKCKTIQSHTDFFEATEKMRMEIIFSHIENGVRFVSVDGVVISPFAKIGRGTEIHPTTEIRGNTEIGENCIIGPCSVIQNSIVGDDCKVNATQIYDAVLEDNVSIGPFSQVRPNSRLCTGVKIGDFVEIKNSTVGDDTHASHLTYIGDSDVGKKVNFGCGTITSNYDGKNKYRTVIGDNVFIGCNTNLIAPVKLGDGSFVAAGSTITEDVPENALGIARSRQTNKEDWAKKRRDEGKLK